MITTTQKYKQEMISGNRNYVVKANLLLADGTPLLLTNTELWDQGVVFDDAISSSNSFDIGKAIIGSLTLVIDNIKGDFSIYDFANATVTLWMGIENDLDENDNQVYYRKGFYVVDNTNYNGSLITLDCLDNMTWFDVPFNEITGLSFPTTAGQLVQDICSHVGVTLAVQHFPNYTMAISQESGEWLAKNNINCREVLQYVAQKCCCYCKIDTAGELRLTWYNKDEINNITNYDGGSFLTVTTPYSDGCDLDGGSFDPWNAGDTADGGTFAELQSGAWLTRNFEMNVSTEDIVITGCRVRSTSGQNQYDELWVDTTLELTHDRYVLVIENNPLITADEASSVANVVGSILANLPLRAFNSRSINDFSYEVGDMVRILDFRGNIYYTWITNLTFTVGNSENFSCGAQSVKQRNEARFSSSAKTLAEADENANSMLTDYDMAVKAMNQLAQNAIGYNKYVNSDNGMEITWLYSGQTIDTTIPNEPTFPSSDNVFMISGDGVFISHGIDPDTGKQVYTEGYDANSGTAILSLLYAVGINCDWLKTGTLTLGGYNNTDGLLKAYANSTWSGSTGTYSGTSVWVPIGYSQVQQTGEIPIDVLIGNISDPSDFKGRYKLFHTSDGGSTWTLLEQSALAEGKCKVSTVLNISSNPANYYQLQITQESGHSATFDYEVHMNKVITTIDRNGLTTLNGYLNGNLTMSATSMIGFDNDDPQGRNLDSFTALRGGFSVKHQIDSQHYGAIAYGTRAADYARYSGVTWTGREFIYYNGSDNANDGGICVATGSPSTADLGTIAALKQSKLIFYKNLYGDAFYEYSQSGPTPGSDRRLKKEIKELPKTKIRKFFNALKSVSFKYKDSEDKRFGVIAQDLEEALETAGLENGVMVGETENGYKNVAYLEFIGLQNAAITDLYERVDKLEKELAELKARKE